jgi:2',3'-cyclic-nucleotide 2'-phosphodiesterase (5'-nucleotidase family)
MMKYRKDCCLSVTKNILRFAYFAFVIFLLPNCKPASSINKVETSSYKFAQTDAPKIDSSVYQTILPFKILVDAVMNDVVCKSSMQFQKNQPEGELGNLISDIVKEEAVKNYSGPDDLPITFCFLNNGGLRASLPEGEITVRNIFELLPFENEIAVITLNGETVKKLLDVFAVKGGVPVAGIKMKIKDSKATDIYIGGQPFDIKAKYKAVTNDYLANGGDNYEFLNDAIRKEITGIKMRDAVLKNLKEKNKKGIIISSTIEGRITYDK